MKIKKAAAFYGKDSFLVEMVEAATDGHDHVDRVLERDALEQQKKEVLIWSTSTMGKISRGG